MSIDISQFTEIFLEESFEGLDLMEAQLLDLQPDDIDAIHSIFRAAHSIKGGAATFGFAAVGEFTHGVETLLDEMRSGGRVVTAEVVRLLLAAVDCIREMLNAMRDGKDIDSERIASVDEAIRLSLGHAPPPGCGQPASPPHPVSAEASIWKIRFAPEPGVMQTGNDPLRLLTALGELGTLEVFCDTSQLPSFENLDPEECWLAWDLRLQGEVERDHVAEVFEWVEDECELVIESEAVSTPEPELAEGLQGNVAAVAEPKVDLQATQGLTSSQSGERTGRSRAQSGSIRVNIDKIDALINIVGELVITQSMLGQVGEDLENEHTGGSLSSLEKLMEGLSQLDRNTRELQESVMGVRMIPIRFAFSRFPRMVHDLGAQLGKQVRLKLSGEQTELDKTVMEKIGDPLVHLVRNAIDHGIETPEKRLAAGKPAEGELHLNAFHKGGNIIIEISDDGAGLARDRILAKAVDRGIVPAEQTLTDDQIDDLIFAPGFSTADQLSDVSGRGVGMDVVRKNIKSLGGKVDVNSSPGAGSVFTIRLPLTLAILDGQLVEVSAERYVIPLISIVESIQVRRECVKTIAERRLLYRLREEYIPILFLDDLLGTRTRPDRSLADSLLVVVESEGQKLALVVHDLLGQQQVVIKALEANLHRVEGLSGATILGDGTVALILDVSGLMNLEKQTGVAPTARSPDENYAV